MKTKILVIALLALFVLGGCFGPKGDSGNTQAGVNTPTGPTSSARIIVSRKVPTVKNLFGSIFGNGPSEALGASSTAVYVVANQAVLPTQTYVGKEAQVSGGAVKITLSPLVTATTTFEAIELQGTVITAVAVVTQNAFNALISANDANQSSINLVLAQPNVQLSWVTTTAIAAGSTKAAFSWTEDVLKAIKFSRTAPTTYGKYYAYVVSTGVAVTGGTTAYTNGTLYSTGNTTLAAIPTTLTTASQMYVVLAYEYLAGGTGTTKYTYRTTMGPYDVLGTLGFEF